ncbi:putative ribonuclease H-like domain-containing protein [Tanacetum coccineum]
MFSTSCFVDMYHVRRFIRLSKVYKDLHQAPRAWYATLSTFLEKHGYRRGTIDKTLFIKKDKKDIMLVQVYIDDIIFGSTRKSWCDEFEALMKGRFQMSSIGELIFFLGLQVKQKTDGIFISQDKLISWQCKKQTIVATSTTEAEYVAAASCCGQTATTSTLADGTLELRATIDTIEYTITEASCSKLVFPDMLPVVAVDSKCKDNAYQAVDYHHRLHITIFISPTWLSATTESERHLEMKFPQSQGTYSSHVAEERTMSVDDLLQLVPKLLTKVDSLETELQQTKLTMGKALVKLVKKGRNLQEEGEEDISPTTLEAAKTLSKVASQRSKSVDKGKIYKRRKESKGTDINTGFEDISTGFEDISTGFEEVNTSGLGVSTAPKRTKEQIQQKEASLAEAIRLQTLEEEETAKQVHLDALLAKRMKEEELIEQQKQRKAQNVIGKELPKEDFARKMVELVNQRKKFFAEESAKARRNTEEKVGKVKEKEPAKRVGTRKKQKARKGISIDKSPQGDSETDKEESVEAMNPTPLDTKSNIVANWKIFQQGERSIYQLIRANGAETVYYELGAMA